MAFKMKGPSLYQNGALGKNLKVQKDYSGQADGRATSSPFQQKEEGKEKLNEWGETPDQYKKRMEEMGLRKPDKKSDKKTPLEQKVTNEDGSTTRTSKNILTGRTKTVTRNEEGKKTSVSKTSKTDKEGNVKYKQKDITRGSGGKKIVHTSKGKYSEKTGAQVGTSKEKVKRNYGPKKGTTRYTEEA